MHNLLFYLTAVGVGFLLLSYSADRLISVAFGTSLPELTAVIVSAKKDLFDIALATAIGSNIFNLLDVLYQLYLLTTVLRRQSERQPCVGIPRNSHTITRHSALV